MRNIFATLLITGSFLIPSLAAAKDTMLLKGTLVPSGFCTVAADGSVGVTLNGVSYSDWFLKYALANQDEVYRNLLVIRGGNELAAKQDFGMLMKAETAFQKLQVHRGQSAKGC